MFDQTSIFIPKTFGRVLEKVYLKNRYVNILLNLRSLNLSIIFIREIWILEYIFNFLSFRVSEPFLKFKNNTKIYFVCEF